MKTYSLLILLALTFLNSNGQTLEWVTSSSSILSNSDMPKDISVDSEGNVLTTGSFWGSMDFDPGPGVETLNSNGDADIFVQKQDSNGNFLWAVSMGSQYFSDVGHSVSADHLGNVYVTGTFYSTIDFDPGPETYYVTPTSSQSDAFLLKLDSNGNFIWATHFGGIDSDEGEKVLCDQYGNVYVTGGFSGTVDFDPGVLVHNLVANVGRNTFILKLDSAANFVWAKQVGGDYGNDVGYSMDVDELGNVYVAGVFTGTADFDPGVNSYELTSNGNTDMYILKLNSSGDFAWAKHLGSYSDWEEAPSIVVDSNGNVLTTGCFDGSADFDPGPSEFSLTTAGRELFIHKLDSIGDFQWVKQVGDNNYAHGWSNTVDETGNVYVSGYMYTNWPSSIDFDPGPGVYELNTSGYGDGFLLKLTSEGDFVWAFDLEDSSLSETSLTIDQDNNLYCTGSHSSNTDFDPGPGIFQFGFSGRFVQKLSQCQESYSTITETACISYTSPSGAYNWTNSGTYTDIIANSADCDSIITINLTIISVDTSVDSDGNTLTAQAENAEYQWLDCNDNFSLIEGETNQQFITQSNGSYAVEITSSGCSDISQCYNITIVNTEDLKFSEELRIYPNPMVNNCTVDLGKLYPHFRISVLDNSQRTILQDEVFDAQKYEIFDKFTPGIYFIRIEVGGQSLVRRLVIVG